MKYFLNSVYVSRTVGLIFLFSSLSSVTLRLLKVERDSLFSFPKYFLMEFYLKTGNNLEAKQVGQKIIAMPEKIPSIESCQIKSRAKYLVDSLKSVY